MYSFCVCALTGADTQVCPYDSKIFFLRSIVDLVATRPESKPEFRVPPLGGRGLSDPRFPAEAGTLNILFLLP